MSSQTASAYLHGIRLDMPNDPPRYNDVIKMTHLPTAPLLDGRFNEPEFSSIFGVATCVQFEYDTASVGSFFIRDSDGSLQAKGDITTHHTVVQSVNGMEMLKIIKRSVDQVNGVPVHTFAIIHNHAPLGTVKVADCTSPNLSLQIFRENGSPIAVNSLNVGDYAVFRSKSFATSLCNIQMPNVFDSNSTEFNIKIIFHPQSGITEEEQLLCTAAAIAFKTTMKAKVEKIAEDNKCLGCLGGICCILILIVVFGVSFIFLDKYACETKRAKGYAGYKNC